MDSQLLAVIVTSGASVIAVLVLFIKSFVDKPKNGYDKILIEIKNELANGINGFRESHIKNEIRQQFITDAVKEIKEHLSTCEDILKSIK